MSVAKELREFASVKEFQQAVEDELARVRNLLGATLDQLRSAQKRAGLAAPSTPIRKLQLGRLEVTLNAAAREESDVLEWAVGTLLTKQKTLQHLSKELDTLRSMDEGAPPRVQVVTGDGLPVQVLLQTPNGG